MATLVLQDASEGLGAVDQTAADAGGDAIVPGSRAAAWGITVALLVNNSDAVAHTVTVEGRPALAVPAFSIAILPVYRGAFGGPPIPVTYDGVTSLFVASVRLAP